MKHYVVQFARSMVVVGLMMTMGCEKGRLRDSRREFRDLLATTMPDEQRVIELARFVERRPNPKTNPFLMEASAAVGRHHARAGRVALAAAWFERAVATGPDEPSMLNLAGYHYAEQETALNRAIDMLSRAVRIAEDRRYSSRQIAFYKDSLGWAHRGIGDFQRALTLLGEASVLAPDVTVIEEHLAQVRRERSGGEKSGVRVFSHGDRSTTTERREIDVGGDLETVLEEGDLPDMDSGAEGTGIELP